MKFLKIARRPAWYSKSLYSMTPHMSAQSFQSQFEWYCSDFFGPVDTWQTYLRQAGIDATDLLCGIEPMDRAWWRENGNGELPTNLIVAQVMHYRPDVLFFEGIEAFSKAEIDLLRECVPSATILAGLTGTDIRHNPALRSLDIVFSCMKGLVGDLRKEGRAAYFLPHSFDPRILNRLPPSRIISEDINFIGNLISGNHMHDNRRAIVEAIAEACDLKIYSNLEKRVSVAAARHAKSLTAYGLAKAMTLTGLAPSRWPIARLRSPSIWSSKPKFFFDKKLASKAAPAAYGLGQYDLLRRAHATLNIHAGLANNLAANMRLYEATGTGTCLLTDASKDITEFFEPDKEVLTFSSLSEAVEKARFICLNPAVADKLGENGQKRTLKDHTFMSRIPILLDAFNTWPRCGRAS